MDNNYNIKNKSNNHNNNNYNNLNNKKNTSLGQKRQGSQLSSGFSWSVFKFGALEGYRSFIKILHEFELIKTPDSIHQLQNCVNR